MPSPKSSGPAATTPPGARSVHMPAEWEPHEKTWIAFPPSNDTFGAADAASLTRARHAWAQVAATIARHEPVSMVVAPQDLEVARQMVSADVDLVAHALNDAWMRDIGPTFVWAERSPGSTGVADETDTAVRRAVLSAVDWTFNGWGAQSWASWEHDAQIGRFVAEYAGVPVLDSALVNEGGGFHVDGEGTVLLTETVQLDPGRNPGATRESVETQIHAHLGTSKAIWLPRGLTRDYDQFGTRGHVDIVAAFAGAGRILVHDQTDPAHPDHAVSLMIRRVLDGQTDARGRELEVIRVPAPTTLRDDHGYVDYSYINHYVANGVVVLCAFDDPNDAVAAEILAAAYPDRSIELVDAREIFANGGGIHCITQQQPGRDSAQTPASRAAHRPWPRQRLKRAR